MLRLLQALWSLPALWALTAALLTVALFLLHDFTHFTWWSLSAFLGYASAGIFGLEHLFFWLFVSIQINVIVGVLGMSFVGHCDLLQDAANTHSAGTYIVGNFAMHYLGLLMAILFIDTQKLASVSFYSSGAILSAYGIFLSYIGAFDAVDVYGCHFHSRWVIFGSVCTTGVLLLVNEYAINV